MKRTAAVFGAVVAAAAVVVAAQERGRIGGERAIARHLTDGDEFVMPIAAVIEYGKKLFCANWTEEDGGGRPLSTGAGVALADPSSPLRGARGFNRFSGPDANSCQGCHNGPGIAGGNGDFVTNSVERAERFDFVSFDRRDTAQRSLATIGNLRATPGLFGAGYLEMLARQMTRELQQIRDAIGPGQSKRLVASSVSFGSLSRGRDGGWNTDAVEGLPASSLATAGAHAPSLVVQPWSHSGSVVSIRAMTNASLNQHHGIQTTEMFGAGTDPDGDGVANELTRADVTALTIFEATLPVPGRVIPNDPVVERAIAAGERLFADIRCTNCHVPSMRLTRRNWTFSDPGSRVLTVDLTSALLPQPRLAAPAGSATLGVAAYTDFKLHDITDSSDRQAAEPIDMNQPSDSPLRASGNRRFLTRRLWGAGNQAPYFHHGLFTTMRQAVLAHAGEALPQRHAFEQLAGSDQDALIEFLKSLQVLPAGTRALVVDEHGRPKVWPRGASTH